MAIEKLNFTKSCKVKVVKLMTPLYIWKTLLERHYRKDIKEKLCQYIIKSNSVYRYS